MGEGGDDFVNGARVELKVDVEFRVRGGDAFDEIVRIVGRRGGRVTGGLGAGRDVFPLDFRRLLFLHFLHFEGAVVDELRFRHGQFGERERFGLLVFCVFIRHGLASGERDEQGDRQEGLDSVFQFQGDSHGGLVLSLYNYYCFLS